MNIKHLFRKIRYGEPIIIVSGVPRSGTSMLMNMLKAGGVEIVSDGIRTADNDNPKGYYELERIKELGKGKDTSWLPPLRGKGIKIISYLLNYLPYNNNYKIIFIERNLQETVTSQNKMLLNRNKPVDPDNDEKMILNFERHLVKIKDILNKDPRFEVIYINHRDVLNNPAEQAKKVNLFLGGRLDEVKMTQAVDPKLYRNRE